MPRYQLDMWPRNMDKLSLIIDSHHLLLQQGEASCKFFARYFFSSEYLFSSPDVYSNLKYKPHFLLHYQSFFLALQYLVNYFLPFMKRVMKFHPYFWSEFHFLIS